MKGKKKPHAAICDPKQEKTQVALERILYKKKTSTTTIDAPHVVITSACRQSWVIIGSIGHHNIHCSWVWHVRS